MGIKEQNMKDLVPKMAALKEIMGLADKAMSESAKERKKKKAMEVVVVQKSKNSPMGDDEDEEEV